jgi:putative endonuclease
VESIALDLSFRVQRGIHCFLICHSERSVESIAFGFNLLATKLDIFMYYVYILASKKNGTLYVGVTSDLKKRMYEHKNKIFKGFTEKYNVNQLVYFEQSQDIYSSIEREKQLKGFNRIKKINIIESVNPQWLDLSIEWFDYNKRQLDSSPSVQNDRSQKDNWILHLRLRMTETKKATGFFTFGSE